MAELKKQENIVFFWQNEHIRNEKIQLKNMKYS